ncbi:MAG: carbohydrate ABC transporter permease [Firmicutes bacterium]|nr:carbohydrate ABC transporter permease [Bacillota bacterium]
MAYRPKRATTFDVFNYIILILLTFVIVYPFYYILINSFNGLLTHRPSFFWPELPTTRTYQTVFADKSLMSAFFVSVARTVVGTAITVVETALCAYALSKPYLRFRGFYMALLIIPTFFNGGTIPVYLNLRNLGLVDSFWVYVLPSGFSFFYMVVLMSAFRNVPSSLEDAALIDGAGCWKIFFRIILPVTIPTFATIALYAAVGQWNQWFDTMYYTKKDSLQTLAAVLMRIIRENLGTDMASDMMSDLENNSYNPEGVKFATMIVSVTPILCIYPFLQKYFVKGIMIGSIKG